MGRAMGLRFGVRLHNMRRGSKARGVTVKGSPRKRQPGDMVNVPVARTI